MKKKENIFLEEMKVGSHTTHLMNVMRSVLVYTGTIDYLLYLAHTICPQYKIVLNNKIKYELYLWYMFWLVCADQGVIEVICKCVLILGSPY